MTTTLTNFQFASSETCKTGETYMTSNEEFLQTLFGEGDKNHCSLVVSFKGHPQKVTKNCWTAAPWRVGGAVPSPDSNNYFTLSVFKPDSLGRYSRKKGQFVALHGIMLDDVGTKVALDRLKLDPSWLLETSSGNYQAGYLLREPIKDIALADQLMNAVISAGLCDPGANGPATRLARLPRGVNGKHTPPFGCQMLVWEPARRYTVGEIVEGLQLEMLPAQRSKHGAKNHFSHALEDEDTVWMPCSGENPVLAALREKGLYKGSLGEGKHDITCPWSSEHTEGVDDGTAYFEPDDNWPIGGFKCLHGHCSNRKVRDLLAFLNIDVEHARMKPTIRIIAGEIHRVVDAAERELACTGSYYQQGGLIVTTSTDPGTYETKIRAISQPALMRALSEAAIWARFDGRSGDWVKTDPPARHTGVLFDSTRYPHLPIIKGLARQPYLRPDGSLMREAGYDPATGMFGAFDPAGFSVPDHPDKTDADRALSIILELLEEFPFAGEADLAGALSAILTAAIRPSLPLAPMYHMHAHMPGSGKSYLCGLITAFATPQRGTPMTLPSDDAECKKLLLAELQQSPAVIEFDNLTSDLTPHNSLCTALTSEYMTGRILGLSKTVSVSTRTLILASGNNVVPVQDMTRRNLTVHLAPQCENPAARAFTRPTLIQDVMKERGRYVSAALSIIRAWIMAGRPQADCRPLAGYGVWSDLCRQPLMWLGLKDPAESVYKAMTEDPDRELLLQLMDAWLLAFGKTGAMVRDAVRKVQGDGSQELQDVLEDIAGERGLINSWKLGRWISRHAGRIVDGKRIVRAVGNCSGERWRVETVS